ncbi:MAG: hydroxymethylbilane synthase [Wenzhouxiangellaceae bacterium]
MQRLVIATRKSRLALWQSEHCAALLREAHPGLQVELLPMSTRGDEVLDRSLTEIGGKGLFLKELEQALLSGRADVAVHSLKDMPAASPKGLAIGALLPRADPRDLWIARDGLAPAELPAGARVGSSSLRRIGQLMAIRQDLEVVPLRGNVETRIRAVVEHRVDATLLAAAGLIRLGIVPVEARFLDPDHWLPAPGQGIIAVQYRTDDAATKAVLQRISDPVSEIQAAAERALVSELGGDCRMPLGALARIDGDELHLSACLSDGQGTVLSVNCSGCANKPEILGREAASRLLGNGGQALLDRLDRS